VWGLPQARIFLEVEDLISAPSMIIMMIIIMMIIMHDA
jgi:hypothetical protein